jgi:hypothetical protein
MGRGLSDLQRWILRESGTISRVYYTDVLVGHYHWKPAREIRRYKAGDMRGHPAKPVPPERFGTISWPMIQYFSRRRIGEAEYSKTMAALSRACRRLDKRGLVTWLPCRSRSAVEITDKGREYLSVYLISASGSS